MRFAGSGRRREREGAFQWSMGKSSERVKPLGSHCVENDRSVSGISHLSFSLIKASLTTSSTSLRPSLAQSSDASTALGTRQHEVVFVFVVKCYFLVRDTTMAMKLHKSRWAVTFSHKPLKPSPDCDNDFSDCVYVWTPRTNTIE